MTISNARSGLTLARTTSLIADWTTDRTDRGDRPVRRLGLLGLVALTSFSFGCAETDRDLYASCDVGTTEFWNTLGRKVVWLGGCNTFVQERWDGVQWVNQDGDIACFWEGFAQPVPAKESRSTSFTARDPGTWRLAYEVGFNCQADQPLRDQFCSHVTQVVTDEFKVLAADDDEGFCTETGGDWNAGYCGDLFCGQPNTCLAIIPGYHCGPDAYFVPGEGCVEDPACDGGANE